MRGDDPYDEFWLMKYMILPPHLRGYAVKANDSFYGTKTERSCSPFVFRLSPIKKVCNDESDSYKPFFYENSFFHGDQVVSFPRFLPLIDNKFVHW